MANCPRCNTATDSEGVCHFCAEVTKRYGEKKLSGMTACQKCGKPTNALSGICVDCTLPSCIKCGKYPAVQNDLCGICNSTMTVKVEKTKDVDVDIEPEQDLDAIKFRMNREWQTDLFSSCESIEEVRQTFLELVRDAQRLHTKEPQAPSGTSFSNPSRGGEPIRELGSGFNQPFANNREMLKFLRDKEAHGSPSERAEAKRILDQLFGRYIRQQRRADEQLRHGIPENERENIKGE